MLALYIRLTFDQFALWSDKLQAAIKKLLSYCDLTHSHFHTHAHTHSYVC